MGTKCGSPTAVALHFHGGLSGQPRGAMTGPKCSNSVNVEEVKGVCADLPQIANRRSLTLLRGQSVSGRATLIRNERVKLAI